jgi:hypothetical protein
MATNEISTKEAVIQSLDDIKGLAVPELHYGFQLKLETIAEIQE